MGLPVSIKNWFTRTNPEEPEEMHTTSSGTTYTSKTPSNNNSSNITINQSNNQITNIIGLDLFNFERIKELRNKSIEKIESLFHYITINKKEIIKWSLAGSYTALQSILLYLRAEINKPNTWSSWQNYKSIDELYQTSQSKLSEMLLRDIQIIYININNPTDFVGPLMKFIKAIEKERSQIALYRSIVNAFNTVYLKWILFYDQALYDKTEEKMKRLDYIKNSFLAWLTDFKVNSSIPQNTRRKVAKLIVPLKLKVGV